MANLFKMEAGSYNALMGKIAERLTLEEGERLLRDQSLLEAAMGSFRKELKLQSVVQPGGSVIFPPHYLVNVNLAEFLLATKAQMEASGEFGWVSDIFDGRLWYDAYSLDGKDIPNVPSGGETVYLMKDFGKDMSSESAIKWGLNEKDEFAPDGYRPATLAEGRAFAKANPKLQLEHPIVILGSFALNGGGRRVAGLIRGGGRRDLGGDWFDPDWDDGCRFLFVRK